MLAPMAAKAPEWSPARRQGQHRIANHACQPGLRESCDTSKARLANDHGAVQPLLEVRERLERVGRDVRLRQELHDILHEQKCPRDLAGYRWGPRRTPGPSAQLATIAEWSLGRDLASLPWVEVPDVGSQHVRVDAVNPPQEDRGATVTAHARAQVSLGWWSSTNFGKSES